MFKQGFLSLALIGAGVLGMSAIPASAGALPAAPQPAVLGGQTADLMVEVKHRRDHRQLRRHWNRKRDGNRCRTRFGNCRHYYRGYYYSSPWWTLPLIGGSIILGNQNYNRGYGNAHIRWCQDRYRSYNVRTNTWVAYSGAVRQCVSPYS
jgi:hypothetical protein